MKNLLRRAEKLAEEEKALREQLRETARAESDAAQAARDAAAAHTAAPLAENSEGAWAAHADAHTLHRRRLMDAAIAAVGIAPFALGLRSLRRRRRRSSNL